MMDGGWWVVGGGWWVTQWVVRNFRPFVDRLLLWQLAVCQSKKDFGELAALRCASPSIF